MKNVFRAELKAGILNWRFAAGTIFIFLASWAVSYPFYQQILETGNSGGENPWMALFHYSQFSQTALLMVPIAAPLAAGEFAETELHSRFAMFSAFRTGKREYPLGKALGLVFSGGLMLCLGQGLVLLLYGLLLQGMWQGEGGCPGLALDLLRSFLSGGLWALVGGLAAVGSKNRYMAYAVPFILYYVLCVFQERYYSEWYVLSPRYWSVPVHFGNMGCILILTALILGAGLAFLCLIRRRLFYG